MRRSILPCLLVLCVAVAGCVVEAPTLQRGPGDFAAPGIDAMNMNAAGDDASGSFDAPAPREVKQWWHFRTTGGGDDTRVIVADQGGSWLVATDNANAAYFDATVDVSTIGPIRKADLAGWQHGMAVEYYHFPLVANDTWTTTWDGAQRTVRVLGPQPAVVGGKPYPAMALEAREGDRVAVRYNYVPAAGWFSFAEFLDPSGNFRLDLASFGGGYNGTVTEARLQPLYHDAGSPLKPAGTFTVPPGTTFLDARGTFEGDVVDVALGFRDPNGDLGHGITLGPCSNCSLGFNATLNGTPGDWGVGIASVVAGNTRPPRAEITILGVVISTRPV